jgi:cytochrome c oxidase assembly factor CtaG
VSGGFTIAASLGDWSLDVPLVLTAALAALYSLGASRTVTPLRAVRAQRLRDCCFYAAILVLVLALVSPIDTFSDKLFWVHMVQHVLLMLVAAPLLVLARPWVRLWRAFPLGLRRPLARAVVKGPRAEPLRAVARWSGSPAGALVLFTVVLLGWHVPALFDATLVSPPVHAVEHVLFVLVAVMYFKQLIPSPPLHAPLGDAGRALYAIAGMTVGWALAVALALAPSALYPHYAHLAARPGGISALGDQQLAAGVMWVPGSITFLILVLIHVHRWLAEPASAEARLAGGHWEVTHE